MYKYTTKEGDKIKRNLKRSGLKYSGSRYDELDRLKPAEAYKNFKNNRIDKSHLTKYPQHVKQSRYYKYLLSKVT